MSFFSLNNRKKVIIGTLPLVILILCCMIYMLIAGNKLNTTSLPIIKSTSEIIIKATTAHLWFEETIFGARSEPIETVWEQLDTAYLYTNSMLKGGIVDTLHILPLEEPALRKKVNDVKNHLINFREIAEKRLMNSSASDLETGLEQQFDSVFNDLILKTNQVKTAIDNHVTKRQSQFRIIQILIILSSGLILLLIGVLLLRLDKNRVQMIRHLNQSEQELEVSEKHQRAIFESVIDGLVVIDGHGIVTNANPAVEKIFGYSVGDLVGKNVKMLMPNPYHSEHDQYIKNYEETGERKIIGNLREVEGRRKDKSNFPIELSVSEMSVKGNKFFVGIIKDISERKHQENKLRQINEELEQFAYIASHDLQEPLRTITSYLQLLEKKYSGALDEKADKYIEFAVNGSLRLKTLIQDLLEFSKLGRDKPVFKKVCVDSTIKSIMLDLSKSIRENEVKFCMGSVPDVYADERMVRSLFQNLIVNAIKYRSDQTPQIEIGATHKGKFEEYFVRDNGIGIDPEYFDKIFGVFQRLHGKQVYEGTGIGLAVCSKIVKQHQGKIWVVSQPGKGATFYFTLPVVQ